MLKCSGHEDKPIWKEHKQSYWEKEVAEYEQTVDKRETQRAAIDKKMAQKELDRVKHLLETIQKEVKKANKFDNRLATLKRHRLSPAEIIY